MSVWYGQKVHNLFLVSYKNGYYKPSSTMHKSNQLCLTKVTKSFSSSYHNDKNHNAKKQEHSLHATNLQKIPTDT